MTTILVDTVQDADATVTAVVTGLDAALSKFQVSYDQDLVLIYDDVNVNVSSIDDVTTGIHDVNFTTAFSSAVYIFGIYAPPQQFLTNTHNARSDRTAGALTQIRTGAQTGTLFDYTVVHSYGLGVLA